MGWMIVDPKLLLDHMSHPLRDPDLSSKAEVFGSLRQQSWQLHPLLLTQFWPGTVRWLIPRGFQVLRPGFLEPWLTSPSVTPSAAALSFVSSFFMQLPGPQASSFVPIFGV